MCSLLGRKKIFSRYVGEMYAWTSWSNAGSCRHFACLPHSTTLKPFLVPDGQRLLCNYNCGRRNTSTEFCSLIQTTCDVTFSYRLNNTCLTFNNSANYTFLRCPKLVVMDVSKVLSSSGFTAVEKGRRNYSAWTTAEMETASWPQTSVIYCNRTDTASYPRRPIRTSKFYDSLRWKGRHDDDDDDDDDEQYLHAFLSLALDWPQLSPSSASSYWIQGRVGHRTRSEGAAKIQISVSAKYRTPVVLSRTWYWVAYRDYLKWKHTKRSIPG